MARSTGHGRWPGFGVVVRLLVLAVAGLAVGVAPVGASASPGSASACGCQHQGAGDGQERANAAGAWVNTKAYTYAPGGKPLALRTKNTDGTNERVRYYTLNPHGDTEALTDGQGETRATYGYTAYGNPEAKTTTGEDQLDADGSLPDDPVNPLQYQAQRLNPATGDYDTGFRNYAPGINRFLSRDMYNGALADAQLGTDPWNTNRYTFTGGNPLTYADLDGHKIVWGDGQISGADDDDMTKSHVSTGDDVSETAARTSSWYKSESDGTQTFDSNTGRFTSDPTVADVAKASGAAIQTAAKVALFDPAACQDGIDAGCAFEVGTALPLAKPLKALKYADEIAKVGDDAEGAVKTTSRGGEDAATTGRTAARTCLRSFAGTTLVLMADGSKKPIEDIKVGDKVVATDPETGERVTRKVTRVWVHDDELSELEFGDGTALATTEDHLFWSVTDQRFERADQLSAGELVYGDGGRRVAVTGLRPETVRNALAYNLSIAGVHTYHVGADEILVHNTCYTSLDALDDPKAIEGLTPSQIDDLARNAGFLVRAGSASAKNPATRYYRPGTNGSQGFRVLPQGVPGQTGVKSGAYLKYFGGPLHGKRIPLETP